MIKNNGVININDENFDKVISQGITIVDFWAPWCMPCRIQGPILEKVSTKVNGNIRVCKMNVDDNMMTAQKYGIISIPTLMIFRDGKVERKFIGVQSEDTLLNAVN